MLMATVTLVFCFFDAVGASISGVTVTLIIAISE